MKKKILAFLTILIAITSTFALAAVASASSFNDGTVYTIDNAATNHVIYYNRASDGSLSGGMSVATGGSGSGIAFHSQGAVVLTDDGHFLLVVNSASNTISVFKILGNGKPVLTSSSTSSHGTAPISLTVHDNWVYVLNAGSTSIHPNIAGFILSKNGILTYLHGSKQSLSLGSSPEQLGFNPEGNVLVVTEKGTNTIATFTVDENGVVDADTTTASAGMGPYGFAFAHENKLVTSEVMTKSTSSYALSEEGSLNTISSAIPTGGSEDTPCWVAINWMNTHVYTGNGGSGTVTSYSISPWGKLAVANTIAATVTGPALDLAFSKYSQFLYVLSGDHITGFRANWDGSLTLVTTTSTFAGSAAGLAAT